MGILAAVSVCFLATSEKTVDYTANAEIMDYDELHREVRDSNVIEVRVKGTIKRSFLGKKRFIGEIVIDGQRFDNEVDLSRLTPILSYYSASRLVSSAYILAHSPDLDKITIVLLKTDHNPRRIVFCNMTYEEAMQMQKVNELPPLSLERDIVPAYVIDTSYEMACKVYGKPLEKNGYHVLKPEKDNDNMIEIVFMAAETEQYAAVFWIREEQSAEWTLFPDTPLVICDPEQWARSDSDTPLTLADVITLSERGDALTWSDFAEYFHTDVGSGLYIWLFPIDETFSLRIGGTSPGTPPMYIDLCVKNGEEEEHIDIREGDVEEFISKLSYTNDTHITEVNF